MRKIEFVKNLKSLFTFEVKFTERVSFFANYAFALTRRVRNVKPFSQGSEIEVQGGAKFARKAINQFSPENAKLKLF